MFGNKSKTIITHIVVAVVQLLSRVQLFDPMDCIPPGSSVLRYLPEFAQIHVHWVNDAIQPHRPLPLPSSPAFNLSQHQGLFQRVSSSHQVFQSIGASAFIGASASATVLPMDIQGRSPGEGSGNPLQYSCLGNPTDRGVWWAIVHVVEKSWIQLSD